MVLRVGFAKEETEPEATHLEDATSVVLSSGFPISPSHALDIAKAAEAFLDATTTASWRTLSRRALPLRGQVAVRFWGRAH